CLRLYKTFMEGKMWLHDIEKDASNENIMIGINKVIFPEYATRIRIKDLGDLFPKNQVFAECFDMDNAGEIEEQYKIIEEAMQALKDKEENANALAQLTYAKMRIELLKIPFIVDMAKQLVDEGNSVVIFVNYKDSLFTLSEKLDTECVIHGDQSDSER